MNMKLVVLEVPYQFPTGFFIQEVSKMHQKEISGARWNNNEIKKTIKVLKQLIHEFQIIMRRLKPDQAAKYPK